jgi:hypothetical protein
MMNAKTVTVLVLTLLASLPAFAFLASMPKPIHTNAVPAVHAAIVLPEVRIAADGEYIELPETKVVVYKAKRYASVIDSNQPPCGSGFWASKANCKLGR